MIANAPPPRLIALARLAEAAGFGQLWMADERFHRDVYASLAMLAPHTASVLLGPCVTDPYSRHPAMTAAAIATLDEQSGGRALLGIGTGLSGFAAMGIARAKPLRAVAEAIDLIGRLMTGATVDFHGETVAFHAAALNFRPVRAHVPVYIASNGPLIQALGGRVAEGVMMEGCGTPAEAAAFVARVRGAAAKAGRDPADVACIARLNCCISARSAAAHDQLRLRAAKTLAGGFMAFHTHADDGLALPPDALAKVAGLPYSGATAPYEALLPWVEERHVDAVTLAGTPDEVAARAAALMAAGIDNFVISPVPVDGEPVEDVIRTFGERIWPQLMRARSP
jgi:5,10-methylenetetrahydromethanopterin reductase